MSFVWYNKAMAIISDDNNIENNKNSAGRVLDVNAKNPNIKNEEIEYDKMDLRGLEKLLLPGL